MFVATFHDPKADQIANLLTRYGLSNRWLADKIGVSHTQVNSWLNGESRPRKGIQIFDEMVQLIREQGAKVALRPGGSRNITVYGGLKAGMPQSQFQDTEEVVVLDWGTDAERWGRRVEGESMSPVLRSGDVAIMEDRRAEPGDVVQVYDDGEDCLKCLRGAPGEQMLWSFNEEFPPFPVGDFKIKGVCVGRIRYGRGGIKSVTDFEHGLKWSMRNDDL